MGAPLPLRRDYDGLAHCALARRSKDADQTWRRLALASICDGGSRSVAGRLGGVGLQIVRDWVLRFDALGPEGLIERKAPGQPARLNAAQRQALAEKVERRQRLTGWCAGGSRIWFSGSSRISASRWTRQRWGAS